MLRTPTAPTKLSAGKISAQGFTKAISGGKSYIPAKVAKELRAAGLGDILHKKTLDRGQVFKAVGILKKQGTIANAGQAGSIFQKAVKVDQRTQAAAEAKRQQFVKTQIMINREQEIAAEDKGQGKVKYDPKSALGKMFSRLEEEKSAPARKLAEKKAALDKLVSDARAKFKPPASDNTFAEPPDLDIG